MKLMYSLFASASIVSTRPFSLALLATLTSGDLAAQLLLHPYIAPPGRSCQSAVPIDLGGYSPFASITSARPGALNRYFNAGSSFVMPPQTIGYRVPTGNANDSRWVAGDFNSDTLTDIAQIWNNNGRATITVYLTQPNGNAVTQHWLLDAGGWVSSNRYLAGDYNNDGYTDIAVAWNNGGIATISTFVSAGSSFYFNGAWASGGSPWGVWNDAAHWIVGDFNGDRLVDIMSVIKDNADPNSDATRHIFWFSTGSSFTARFEGPFTRMWGIMTALVPMNLNGDLLTDFMEFGHYLSVPSLEVRGHIRSTPTSTTYLQINKSIKNFDADPGARFIPGDFNGDGRSELLVVYTKNAVAKFGLVTWDQSFTYDSIIFTPWNTLPSVPAATTVFCPGVFRIPQ